KSNEELNVAVAAADRMIVARGLHYPNSNLVKAVALGRPCVFAGPRLAVRRAAQLPGVHTSSLAHVDLEAALSRCLQDSPVAPRGGYGHHHFVKALLG